MYKTGQFEWYLITTPLKFKELSADPANSAVPANTISLYAKDNSGVSNLYFKDDGGTVHDLGNPTVTGHALTRVNDTNVTLTLGGSPTTALLAATSLTLGWSGTLAVARGGTGQSTVAGYNALLDHGTLLGLADDDHTQYVLRSILTTNGDLFTRSSGVVSRIGVGTEGQVLEVVSGAPAWADPPASGGGGHLHGLMRVLSDGATTVWNLLDIAEYVERITNAGSELDPAGYTLSSDGSQVTLSAAPTDENVLVFEYVIAGI